MKKAKKILLAVLCGAMALCGFTACGEMFQVHVHFYDAKITQPTCTEKGYTTYTCECGDTYTADETEAVGHNYTDYVSNGDGTESAKCKNCWEVITREGVHTHNYKQVIVKPTCTEDGYTTYTCDCGDTYTGDEIKAKGHTEVIDLGKEATCTQAGLTDGKHCSTCNTVLVVQTLIPAKNHTEVVDKGYAATCTIPGLTDGKHCSTCQTILEKQTVIGATGHTEIIVAGKAATCTETGLTDGKYCTVCKTTTLAQTEIGAKGHTEVIDLGKAATCTETGLTDGKHCSTCQTVLVAQTLIPAKNHTEVVDYGYGATCTQKGLTNGKHCSTCHTVLQAQTEIAAKGHTEIIVAGKEATCTETGLTNGKYCTTCQTTTLAQTVIGAKGHTEVIDLGKVATCKETGLTNGKHCSTCNTVIVAQEVIPMGDHTEITLNGYGATCKQDGLTDGKKCAVCGTITVAQTSIPKGAHVEEWIVEREATCGSAGLKHAKCSVCDEIFSTQTIPALAHNYIETAYATGGYSKFECENCHDTYFVSTGTNPLTYTVNSDNRTCTVTGVSDASVTAIYIPESIAGYTVTDIAERAFADQTQITEIILPNTLKTIGTRAFYNCTGLTEITIPSSVTSIGTQIFYRATALETVYYNGAYGSSSNAFLNTASIKKVVFGRSSIPSYVLYNCSNVQTVEIKNNVTSIGNYAFQGCTGLTGVYITDLTAWCKISFRSSYYSYYYRNPLEYARNLYLNNELVTELVIPNGITSIGSSAFYNCDSLTSVVIPESVTSIGDYAFSGCNSLTNIYITDLTAWCKISGLTYLTAGSASKNLYLNNELVTELVLPDTFSSIPAYAFRGFDSITEIVIPDSVTSIGSYAFYNCSKLTSVVIGDSVTSIGSSAFAYCSSLTEIVIPDSVTSIGEDAFYYCDSLTEIVIPDSVMSIGEYAFSSCSSLTEIVIPDSVTSIGGSAFYNCDSLTIYCEAERKPSGWDSNWNRSYNSANGSYYSLPVVWGYTGMTYTYTFETNGGDEMESVSSKAPLALPTPVKEGCVFIGWYDNAECSSERVLSPYYMKANATLYAKWMTEEEYQYVLGTSFEWAIQAECGTYSVVIDEAGERVYFVFTPTESRTYTIKSENNSGDTFGHLYNASQSQITSDDDGGNNNNFRITYNLNAGQTYYIVVRMYSSSNTGSFQLNIA